MYIVYCQNKPKSEHIVSEYIDTYFEVRTKTETMASHIRLFLRKQSAFIKVLFLLTGS